MDEDQEAEEDERGRVAPNMGAGGSHPQATSDPGKKKKETRVLRWADCNDEEEEKETGQREMTDERPPGLEEVESESKTQQEKEPSQVESEQEVREEERRTQEVRVQKGAQEAREQKRAQEAREHEERRAHEAREGREESAGGARAKESAGGARGRGEESAWGEKRKEVQEARENEAKAQEERERLAREAKAQEERKREVSARGERESQVREARAEEERTEQERKVEAQEGQENDVKAQEGHEGKVKAQEGQGEDANSLHEEGHVSNRHMTWWHHAWWVRVNNGPHLRTARDRRKVWRAATRAAQEVRETGKGAGGEREMGDGKKRKQRKRLAPGLPLSQCKYTSSSSSDGALAMILFVRAASVTRRGWSLAGGPSSPRTLCSW